MFKHITVYGYVRVSGAGQADKDGPVRQQKAIEEFCQMHALGGVRFYSDLGVSGTLEGLHRPEFINLISDAEVNGVKIVVVERLDRLARDLIVSEMLIRQLRSRGIALYSTDQGCVDLVTADSDPSRKLIRQIFSAMAEYDKSALVIKLRAARERKRKETGKCEGIRGFEETAFGRRVLELIIRMRLDGLSWRGVADMLTRDKVCKASGVQTPWSCDEAFRLWKRYDARLKKEKERQNDNLHLLRPEGM